MLFIIEGLPSASVIFRDTFFFLVHRPRACVFMSSSVLFFTFKMFSEGGGGREAIARAHFNTRDPVV